MVQPTKKKGSCFFPSLKVSFLRHFWLWCKLPPQPCNGSMKAAVRAQTNHFLRIFLYVLWRCLCVLCKFLLLVFFLLGEGRWPILSAAFKCFSSLNLTHKMMPLWYFRPKLHGKVVNSEQIWAIWGTNIMQAVFVFE